MQLYRGGIEDIINIYNTVKEFLKADVYGYKRYGNSLVFDFIESSSELPIDVHVVQRPGFYRVSRGFGFIHSSHSPKNLLYPFKQELFRVDQELNIKTLENSLKPVILFGIKPCDVAAINVFDKLFGNNFNPYYLNRRRSVVGIVVEECLNPGETCFCSTMGTGPDARNGFDLAFAKVDRDLVIFKAGSSLGEKIVAKANLQKASDDDVKRYEILLEEAKRKTNLGIGVEDIQTSLEKSITDVELWRKVSEKCVGCANCNMVCPTCFCSEIVDDVVGDEAVRIMQLIGCLSYTYGLVAGGHFRKELYTRYRHFILHKFVFYPKQIGLFGCVGCGRCSVWCPVGIDIRETVKTVASRYRG